MDKKILLMFVIVIMISCCYGVIAPDQTFTRGDTIDLKIPCFNNGTYCSGSATCNLTIDYPNGTVMVDNQLMTNSVAYHNYTLPDSDVIGTYFCSTTCVDGGNTGYSRYTFDITTTGFAGEGMMNIIFFIIVGFAVVILSLGLSKGDPIFVILSSFIFIISGLIVYFYPLGYLSDLVNIAFAYILWGIGAYILIKSSIELLGGA
ncbi:MAG: hypothetical protein JSW08_01985 [archaeon]|nr:MAG: hypothetical protein JSW08_01985 [archaeon]